MRSSRLGAAHRERQVTIEVTRRRSASAPHARAPRRCARKTCAQKSTRTEAREIAARSMGLSPETVRLAAATDQVRVFQASRGTHSGAYSVRARAGARPSIAKGSFVFSARWVVAGSDRADRPRGDAPSWEEVPFTRDSVIRLTCS